MCIFIFIPLSTFNCLLFLLLWYCELLKLLLLCAIFTFPPAVTAACKWRYITLWFNNHRITNCNSIVLKCLLCAMLPFARQASQDLSSHVFVLSLIDRKISQFCCIFHTQCWVCHHLCHISILAIALGWIDCQHDGNIDPPSSEGKDDAIAVSSSSKRSRSWLVGCPLIFVTVHSATALRISCSVIVILL